MAQLGPKTLYAMAMCFLPTCWLDAEDPGWDSVAMQDSGAPGKKPGHPNDFAEQNTFLPLVILGCEQQKPLLCQVGGVC